MSRPPSMDAQLEASLRRIGGALERNRNQYSGMVERVVAATGDELADRIAAKTEHVTARIADRHQRRMDRWQRREERRRQRRLGQQGPDEAAVPRGIVFSVAAVVCLLLAVTEPALFWMVFVGLGFGMSAVSSFSRAGRHGRVEDPQAQDESGGVATAKRAGTNAAETVPPAVAEPADPKVTRIQTLCDKLLAELESGPPIVREVVREPQATIGGLRQACLETARRERELRSVLAAQDEAGLAAEREALATRISNEHDEIVRDRLGQALRALEEQLAHRAELTTAAARLEAENTRILYTLENLHMQLLRARSTDMGAPELGGKLRDSLRDLGTQIDAVAEALEWASAPSVPDSRTAAERTPEATAGSGTSATATVPDTQRAEREAAARRAAQAREAQRH